MRWMMLVLLAGGVLAPAVHAQAPWRFESPREEIAPRGWQDAAVRYDGEPTLALAGDGRPFADGRWTHTVAVEPDAYYRFAAHYLARGVDAPAHSVFARLLWQDAQGALLGQAEYPATRGDGAPGGWRLLERTYRSPAGAAAARLELVYRWDADGEVYFAPATLERVAAPPPRRVRLASVRYRPHESPSARHNLERFATLVAEAAARGADIVCLPEGATLVGTGRTYVEASEPVPGPSTAFLGDVARAHGVYVVAGLLEREGAAVYNTAVLIGRDGALVGKYRKVSLPREEYEGGITPGDTFPTFETDFGRIGLMICWDVSFPEAARALALGGAEVILMPIWGGITLLARARAVENQVYLVTSSYDMESGIFDPEGTLRAEATDADPVAVVEVDLAQHTDWPWLGDFKSRIPRERPPDHTHRDEARQ